MLNIVVFFIFIFILNLIFNIFSITYIAWIIHVWMAACSQRIVMALDHTFYYPVFFVNNSLTKQKFLEKK